MTTATAAIVIALGAQQKVPFPMAADLLERSLKAPKVQATYTRKALKGTFGGHETPKVTGHLGGAGLLAKSRGDGLDQLH
jgi:hypothetical protein